MKKILIVEDDKNAGFLLKDNLEFANYIVALAINGEEGILKFKSESFDLCILDIMMPIKDGITLAKEIRIINQKIPIIFLTARNLDNDKIEGFKIGCDDYITKPYNIEELLLRIKAVLKRTNTELSSSKTSTIGNITIDYINREIKTDSNIYKISNKESELLKIFCENINEAIPRDMILKNVWGKDDVFSANSMDVHLTKIRKYLNDDKNIHIQNIHGYGFKLVDNTKKSPNHHKGNIGD